MNVDPTIEVKELSIGQEVLLNEAYNVIDTRAFDSAGEVVTVKEVIGDDRVIILGRGDEERVVGLSGPMEEEFLRAGDHVRMDPRTGLILEKLIRPEVGELVLEGSPTSPTTQIGGLGDQIETIRDAIELPYVHKDRFEEYELVASERRAAVRPSRMRQDADRQGGREQPGEGRRREGGDVTTPGPTSSTSRDPNSSTSTSARPSGRSA